MQRASVNDYDDRLRRAVLRWFLVFATVMNVAVVYAVYSAFMEDQALARTTKTAGHAVTPAVLVALVIGAVVQVGLGRFALRRSWRSR